MSDRKLASVRRIDNLEPIEGADRILKATIGGWQLVTAKDNGFKIGDLVVYLEIDSWVPTSVAPFLTKEGQYPKVYNGIEGERLKTIKLRGQVSQGLILPLADAIGRWVGSEHDSGEEISEYFLEGSDLTELLGITKWERPENPQLAGISRGSFPHFIRKTDQERCQNMVREIFEKHKDTRYEVTIKLDGSSMTGYNHISYDFGVPQPYIDSEVGVCSRNMNLQIDQEGNSFVRVAKESGLLDSLKKYGRNIAVQGELMGTGIQGNREGINGHKFFVYDVWNIDAQKYMSFEERSITIANLIHVGADIQHVPVIAHNVTLEDLGITNVAELLAFAEGKSLNHPVREGLVFKAMDGSFSFKAISNAYLLKGGE